MGLFGKPKYSYVQLSVPKLNSFALPDPRVMQKDMAMVAKIVEITIGNMQKTAGSIAQTLPAVSCLERQLVAAFSQGDDGLLQQLAPQVYMGVRGGYFMGLLENNSGIARHDACETHYWTALIVLKMQLREEGLDPFVSAAAGYAFEAGYYLARKGDVAISEILATLTTELKAA